MNDKQIVSMMLEFISTDDYPSKLIRETLYERWGLIEFDFAGFSFESREA